MLFQQILQEAQQLSIADRHELIKRLLDTLPTGPASDVANAKRSLLELEELGAEIWQGIDAQQYVNALRAEWDHRL